LLSASFPNDLKAYSDSMAWAVAHVQDLVTKQRTTSTECYGRLGGGKALPDGGAFVYEATRNGMSWTIKSSRIDAEKMKSLRAKKDGFDEDKEYYSPAEAILKIEGENWSITLPKVSAAVRATGVITK
jgi:hypothetical protein